MCSNSGSVWNLVWCVGSFDFMLGKVLLLLLLLGGVSGCILRVSGFFLFVGRFCRGGRRGFYLHVKSKCIFRRFVRYFFVDNLNLSRWMNWILDEMMSPAVYLKNQKRKKGFYILHRYRRKLKIWECSEIMAWEIATSIILHYSSIGNKDILFELCVLYDRDSR